MVREEHLQFKEYDAGIKFAVFYTICCSLQLSENSGNPRRNVISLRILQG